MIFRSVRRNQPACNATRCPIFFFLFMTKSNYQNLMKSCDVFAKLEGRKLCAMCDGRKLRFQMTQLSLSVFCPSAVISQVDDSFRSFEAAAVSEM